MDWVRIGTRLRSIVLRDEHTHTHTIVLSRISFASGDSARKHGAFTSIALGP